MPELPEVRTVAKNLREFVKGKVIQSVQVHHAKFIKNVSPDFFCKTLTGRHIFDVTNIGKFLVFNFDGLVMLSHLRMTGSYSLVDGAPPKHSYVEFDLGTTKLCYLDPRQFGAFYLFQNKDFLMVPPLSKLAKEPAKTDPKDLFQKLQRKSVAIKTVLLDQSILVGLGNIYVDETLWQVKIDPRTPAKNLSLKQVSEILEAATIIMDKATELGGTTIYTFTSFNTNKGSFQDFLQVHTRAGKPCPRCGTTITKTRINGRGTYFCSKEQCH